MGVFVIQDKVVIKRFQWKLLHAFALQGKMKMMLYEDSYDDFFIIPIELETSPAYLESIL